MVSFRFAGGHGNEDSGRGHSYQQPAADVYGLGAVLFALLTGRPPFQGATALDTLLDVKQRDPDRPSRHHRALDPTLEAICLKCLAKDPRQRYASAAALADDLEHWLADEPTVARPERWPGRVQRWLRKHRRQVVLALAAALPAATILITLAVFRGPSPEEAEAARQQQALQALEQDLAVGQAVELLGPTGAPGWFQWRTTDPTDRITQAADGAFAIQSWAYGLLELLPDLQCDHYRFRAEVRHDYSNGIHGWVGIYFGYSSTFTDGSIEHRYCKVEYNDRFDHAKHDPQWPHAGNPVRLVLHSHLEPSLVNRSFDPSVETFFHPIGLGVEGVWRRLAVEVRPKDIRMFWEDRQPRTLSREQLRKHAGQDLNLVSGQVPEFAPREGLGLYVYASAASFRNVVVEPLEEKNDGR